MARLLCSAPWSQMILIAANRANTASAGACPSAPCAFPGIDQPPPLLMLSHRFNSDSPPARSHATCQITNCCPRAQRCRAPLLRAAGRSASFITPFHNPSCPPNHLARSSPSHSRGTGEQSRERRPVSKGGLGEALGEQVKPRVCPRTGQLLWACHPAWEAV